MVEDNYRLSESEKTLRQQIADLKQGSKKTHEVDKSTITAIREELDNQKDIIILKESQIRKLRDNLTEKDRHYRFAQTEISLAKQEILTLQNEVERVEKENNELHVQLDTCTRHVQIIEREVDSNRDIILTLRNNLQNIPPQNDVDNMADAAAISTAVTTAFKELL